jgi:hypothetical protein
MAILVVVTITLGYLYSRRKKKRPRRLYPRLEEFPSAESEDSDSGSRYESSHGSGQGRTRRESGKNLVPESVSESSPDDGVCADEDLELRPRANPLSGSE